MRLALKPLLKNAHIASAAADDLRRIAHEGDHTRRLALAREIGRAVRLQVEPSYGPGQFDIVLVQDMRRSG